MDTKHFSEKLNILNSKLSDSLIKKNYESVLIGNLFYDHLQTNFQINNPNVILQTKRNRLFDLSKKCSNVFEVGVNGGHSAFLMLESNPELKYIGNDICAFYPPEPRCHPEIYVPVAFDTLKDLFPGRVTTITGDCLIELPKYAERNNFQHIDLLHLDGHKQKYPRDFFALLPCLKKNAYVVFDDTQQEFVQSLVNDLLHKGIVKRCEYPKMEAHEIFTHEIVQVNN